ncbi:MAG: nucleotide exchange factor GrpE [Firmicutes bacterium]|nr:nucleotide exchange factor GrpE [Bacillota bacterium]
MSKHHHSVEEVEKGQVQKDVEVYASEGASTPQGMTAIEEPEATASQPAEEAGPVGGNMEERIGLLEQELKAAQQAKEEYYNRLLRTQADFENYRRRNRQEMEQLVIYAGEELLKKILPVVDSLERAVSCFTEKTDSSSWQDGVQLTLKQFKNILQSEGLEPIPAKDNPFDPQVHEAVCQEESVEVERPMVVEELQKGYKYKNKLLRPALVKVASPASTAQPGSETEQQE